MADMLIPYVTYRKHGPTDYALAAGVPQMICEQDPDRVGLVLYNLTLEAFAYAPTPEVILGLVPIADGLRFPVSLTALTYPYMIGEEWWVVSTNPSTLRVWEITLRN